MSETPRTDARGVLATIHRDGYWTNKMPEQDPFPYLSHHQSIDVCRADELSEARAELRIANAKNAGSLANNLCPDHRDKQVGKPCLACSLERLEAALEEARRALHEISEEWAGAECGEPVTAQEGYAINLCKRMYSIAVASMSREGE